MFRKKYNNIEKNLREKVQVCSGIIFEKRSGKFSKNKCSGKCSKKVFRKNVKKFLPAIL